MSTVITPFDPTEAVTRVENNRASQDVQQALHGEFWPRWKTVVAAVRGVRAAIDLQRLDRSRAGNHTTTTVFDIVCDQVNVIGTVKSAVPLLERLGMRTG